jgi:hypothetical protein
MFSNKLDKYRISDLEREVRNLKEELRNKEQLINGMRNDSLTRGQIILNEIETAGIRTNLPLMNILKTRCLEFSTLLHELEMGVYDKEDD